jgi:hypothetical protein
LLLEESGGVVSCELSVPSGQGWPAPAPVLSVHSALVLLELLLELVLSLGLAVPLEPSARRIVPELCVLPVSALVSESESERMLSHPINPAPSIVDATTAIKYRLLMPPPHVAVLQSGGRSLHRSWKFATCIPASALVP